MFSTFFGFEWRLRRRGRMLWILCALFAFFTVLLMAWPDAIVPGSGGKIARNSPFAISIYFINVSVLGMFVAAAFVASGVQRDHALRIDSLFYSMPIGRHGYLAGRFFGGLAPALLVTVFTALAHALATFSPTIPAEELVDGSLAAYAAALALFVVPNFFVMGALAFCLATLTRRVLWGYIGLILVLVLYALSQAYLSDLDNRTIAAMADPFGAAAWGDATRYWTIAEKNEAVLLADATLLGNRALWTGLGLALLAFTHARFRPLVVAESSRERAQVDTPTPTPTPGAGGPMPLADREFGARAQALQLWVQTRSEARWITRKVGFVVLAAFGVVNVVGVANALSRDLFGTPVYPVTRLMLEAAEGGFSIFLLAIITVYSGAMVWREREAKAHEIHDALPVPDWIPLASKLLALLGAVLMLHAASALGAIAYQAANGFFAVEPGLFVRGLLLVGFPGWIEVTVLAFAVQVLVNNKYLGFGVMTAYFVALALLPEMGVEHNLVLYGQTPGSPYSDMNGYGHFTRAVGWFHVYWLAAAAILILLGNLFWVRGTHTSLPMRAREARRRVDRGNTLALVVAVLVFLGVGAYVFHNTNVLNTYKTSDEREREQADFERAYKQYEGVTQPRVTAVALEVDIFPHERSVHVRGDLSLVNETDAPIDSLHLILDPELHVIALGLPESARTHHDARLGYSIYALPTPLAPGAEFVLHFEVRRDNPGFVNSGSDTGIVRNGTFFDNSAVVPMIGYSRQLELSDPDTRRKHDLPERARMAKVDDERARMNTYVSHEADWIDFRATVSTVPEQIALAPGYLQKEWTEGGRRYFQYAMDAPILDFYAFLSAEYEVVRDEWNGVAIEVYHHAPHAYNVAKMIESMKDSLAYFSTNFSPYQHRQARIIEFPRYANFAQSFPNTIPYSEGIGFIAELVDPNDIDYVYYVTAHEIAHQWWAHQVIGGDVQGSTLMSETMAQYSALMVMEKKYGRDHMKKFLRHELDGYLRGRGSERIEEMPLLVVENQPYIHYNKGSVVMYALREYIGEQALNRALAAYIREVAFQEPPFTNSLEFLEHIRRETPADRQYILEDWFETVTLYDNRAIAADWTQTPEGDYRVRLTVAARKLRADGQGNEQEIEVDDLVQIGVFGDTVKDARGADQETVLYREMHRLGPGETELVLTVAEQPVRAGIDPMILLIDRNPQDNVVDVTPAG